MSIRPHLCFMVTSSLTAVTFLRGYMSFLREQGWEVTVVCSPGTGVAEMARAEGVVLRTIEMRREPSPFRDLISLVRAVAALRELRPDVVVYATPKASLIGALAGAVVGVRVRVYEQWGLRLETLSGFRWRLHVGIERLIARLSTTIIANSRSLADRLRELKLDMQRELLVLGQGSAHGVDTEAFKPDGQYGDPDRATLDFLSQCDDAMRVCFVGRLHPDKGIDTLVEAVAIASRSAQIATLMIGPHEGAKVPSCDPGVAIRFVGEVADVRPYLQVSDVLVLMSRREGYPTVVLEAAAMGVPAIVADSTGTVDSVQNGITGVVLPVGDSAALAIELGRLARDRDLLHRYGDSARMHVLENYAQSHVWKLHSDLFYERFANARGNGVTA